MSVNGRIQGLSHQDEIPSSFLSPLITSLYHSHICVSLLGSFYHFFLFPSSLPLTFPLSLGCSLFLICISKLPFSNISPRHTFLPVLSLLSCLSLCKISLFLLSLSETLLMLALAHFCCMACQWMTNDSLLHGAARSITVLLTFIGMLNSMTLLLYLKGKVQANTDVVIIIPLISGHSPSQAPKTSISYVFVCPSNLPGKCLHLSTLPTTPPPCVTRAFCYNFVFPKQR